MNEEIKIITLGDIFKNLETEEKAFKLKDYIISLQKELDQYKNNWKELKRWLNTKITDYKKYDIDDFTIYQHILNKMKELEEDK